MHRDTARVRVVLEDTACTGCDLHSLVHRLIGYVWIAVCASNECREGEVACGRGVEE